MYRIEELPFYSKVKDYYNKCTIKIVDIPSDSFITGRYGDQFAMHYILKGKVKVYSISLSGRQILLDEVSEGMFCGNLTKVLGHKFKPSLVSGSDCELLYFPEKVFSELLLDSEFAAFFYRSAVDRIYYTYQSLLLANNFSVKEIVAFYIYSFKRNKYFELSLAALEEDLVISRRSVFYIIKQLKDEGILSEKNKLYSISDMEKLEKCVENIRLFKESMQ